MIQIEDGGDLSNDKPNNSSMIGTEGMKFESASSGSKKD